MKLTTSDKMFIIILFVLLAALCSDGKAQSNRTHANLWRTTIISGGVQPYIMGPAVRVDHFFYKHVGIYAEYSIGTFTLPSKEKLKRSSTFSVGYSSYLPTGFRNDAFFIVGAGASYHIFPQIPADPFSQLGRHMTDPYTATVTTGWGNSHVAIIVTTDIINLTSTRLLVGYRFGKNLRR